MVVHGFTKTGSIKKKVRDVCSYMFSNSECSWSYYTCVITHGLVLFLFLREPVLSFINDVTIHGFCEVSLEHVSHLGQVGGELLHIPPHVSTQLRHLASVEVRVKRSKSVLSMFIFMFVLPFMNFI